MIIIRNVIKHFQIVEDLLIRFVFLTTIVKLNLGALITVCLSVCVSVCVSVCLSVCLSVCVYVRTNEILNRKNFSIKNMETPGYEP